MYLPLQALWLACLLCQGVPEEPRLQQSHLLQAAACLEQGDDRAACEHLRLYLAAHPEHRNARFYYGELLLKLGRHAEARGQYELTIRREQEEAEPDLRHLVHCHTRLLEIGDVLGDPYLERLHRGIALVLLARRATALADVPGTPATEGLLCKALAELKRAQALRPAEARPCWYLHLAWRQLGQHEPARRCLGEAGRFAPFTNLTPTERRDLLLAAAILEPRP
jgi:tetratricopeptide (TPR) repeat protein